MRSIFVCLVLFANIAAPSLCAADKPNVVVVIADQWQVNAFGYAGNKDVKTPNMDRLERESLHFINAVSTLPVCSPTRASFLTGQHALTHGVFLNDVSLNPEANTIAKVMTFAGYTTGFIGKWHVDGHGRSNFIPHERRQGFEYWKVLECTHDYNNSPYYADGPEKLKWDGYDAIAQTKDAQEYLRSRAKDQKPFLLFLAWGPPHDPYGTAPEKYRNLYHADELQLRGNVPEGMTRQARKTLVGYYGHCSALDDCMGELRATLKETGLDKNTIVIFTADHGDLQASHNFYHKQQPYDESVRVPFLVSLPERYGAKPRKFDAPICSEDLMPTILGLCGVAIPASVEGKDYSKHLLGGESPSDGAALITCVAPFGQWTRQMGGKEYRGVRTTRYTYVRDLNGPWLLYDNQNDPFQLDNLVGKPELSAKQAELETILQRKLKEQKDEFLPARTYIEKWGYKVDASGTVPYTP